MATEGETLTTADAERVAADELRRLLADVRKQMEYPLVMKYQADPAVDATNAYQGRKELERLIEELGVGTTPLTLPQSQMEIIPSPFPPALEAVLTFLGLHPQERAFVRHLAENRLDGDTAHVYADWLEENGRTWAGASVRELHIKAGNILALWMPANGQLGWQDFARKYAGEIADDTGLQVLVIPDGQDVASLSPGMMRKAGWVRVEEIAAEREACAQLAERWRERRDIQAPDAIDHYIGVSLPVGVAGQQFVLTNNGTDPITVDNGVVQPGVSAMLICQSPGHWYILGGSA